MLKQFFEPVVLKITTSKKSHCKSQIGAFNNITFEQFELIKSEKLELNRKSGFEVWTVKKEQFTYNVIAHHVDHNEVVTNNHHGDDTDNINIDLVFDDVSETIDSVFNYDDITNNFSSFCG